MEREAFEQLVAEAIESLPAVLKRRIENVSVEVMPIAPAEIADGLGRHPWSLLGVYRGVPFNRRGTWYGNVLPDRILIFQKPIERLCQNAEQVKSLVRRVVIHEVGHYFGLSEAELSRLESARSEQ
ncbi:MAG: metallopeptidase family protein [candidate division WOR-3 bacterium]